VWGANATPPANFFPLISAGNSVATGELEVQVLPGPFRLRPDLTVTYDGELLKCERMKAEAVVVCGSPGCRGAHRPADREPATALPSGWRNELPHIGYRSGRCLRSALRSS
jgi:hypothetical protein